MKKLMKEKRIIMFVVVSVFCLLAVVWSFWAMAKFYKPDLKLNLGVAEQRNVWDQELVVYLDNKPLPGCSEEIETRVCVFACAPAGSCLFIPMELIDKYEFNK